MPGSWLRGSLTLMEREVPILGHPESEIADEVDLAISQVLPTLLSWWLEGANGRAVPGVLVPIILRAQQCACLALLRELFDQPNMEEAVGLKIRELEIKTKKIDQMEGV